MGYGIALLAALALLWPTASVPFAAAGIATYLVFVWAAERSSLILVGAALLVIAALV